MKLFKTIILGLLLLMVTVIALPEQASAWNPFQDACRGGASTSAVCKDGDATENPISGTDGVVMRVVDFVAFVGGLAAIIIIILAGLRFVTSSGSSEDIAGARRTLIYAVVGLVVLVLARTLVALILANLS